MRALLAAYVLLFLLCGSLGFPDHSTPIPVAGFFTEDQWEQEIAFRYAIDRINMDISILPKSKLIPIIERSTARDSFEAEKKVCNVTAVGVAAVFGPQDIMSSGIVRSICETLEIPNLQSHWQINENRLSRWTIKMHPDPKILSQGLADLIADMEWKSFTVLYDTDESLIQLQAVLKLHGPDDPPITIRQLDPNDDHRTLLKEIQMSGESHIVLHCRPERVLTVLRQAKEVKLMEDYQSYIITHLDTHTIDFGDFKYGRTNITSIRLIDPGDSVVQNAIRDWIEGEKRGGLMLDITPNVVKTETALVYDSVQLFAKAVNLLDEPKKRITASPLNCDGIETWSHGYSLVNYMRLVETKGMSGPIAFDKNDGRRTIFRLDIVELTKTGFKKIGSWDPLHKVNYTRTLGDIYSQIVERLENKTFIVVSRLGPPYLMYKQNQEGLSGNDRFEGYSINLIDEIAKELNFKYEFYLTPDGKYGSYNKITKKWDGLVKQLLDRKADLAICDLTITYERESAVDFTMPFMTLGISILYSKPMKQPSNLFSFLSPFSLDVWMYMATAYLGVSLLLFVLSRMTPFEWENPHPCNEDCKELESKFNLVNCLWFSLGSLMGQGCDILPKISPFEWSNFHPERSAATKAMPEMSLSNSIWHNCGSLMQQGSDIAPKAVSTRIVAGMWWFFALIMISSYTANLAAFLTIDRMEIEIENVEDLAKQTKIKYGAVVEGSTVAFFKRNGGRTKEELPGMGDATKFLRWHLPMAAVSTRMVAGMWWFFTLIMISSYTANLAAFLTVERMDVTIENAEDLAKQTKIKYGAVIGGSTAGFFKNSNFSTYQRMWAAMESARPSVFTSSNDEGVERVLKGKRSYAFLMESTSIEYQVERNCELQQIGGLLDSKGYGIAMPVNSPYRTAISGAVLKMQEDGRLHMLKEKWWKEMNNGGSCKDDHLTSDASQAELGLANVGGVFVVLVLGCAFGFLMAVLEFLWNIRKIAVEEEITLKEALVVELKFALACRGTTKPVRKKKNSIKSSQSAASSIQVDNFECENSQKSQK